MAVNNPYENFPQGVSQNFPSSFYAKPAPLRVPLDPEIANYEDKIISDEIRRQMNMMVKDAEDRGVEVRTDLFQQGLDDATNRFNIAKDLYQDGLIDERRLEKAHTALINAQNTVARDQELAREYGLSEPIKGSWYSNNRDRVVNVPRTPTLENYFIMAEEIAHQFGRKEPTIDNRAEAITDRYEEEKRAKAAALDRIGGRMTPETQDLARFTMDSYRSSLADAMAYEEMQRQAGRDANQNNIVASDNIFEDPYETEDNLRAYDYWSGQNTTPYYYMRENYPEFRRTGPLQNPERFGELVEFFKPMEWDWENIQQPIESPSIR